MKIWRVFTAEKFPKIFEYCIIVEHIIVDSIRVKRKYFGRIEILLGSKDNACAPLLVEKSCGKIAKTRRESNLLC